MDNGQKQEGGFRLRAEGRSRTPLVSVVMVTFNPGLQFLQALDSALAGGDRVEVLVVDGGSTDGTLDRIRAYGDRIDYWISEKDRGIYDAMNKGLALARGEWVGFKNADDWFCAGAFERLAEKAAAHPEVDVWYGHSLSVIREEPLETAPFFTDERSIGGNPGVDHRSLFVRTRLHQAHPFDLRYRLAADLDVFWRLKQAGARFGHLESFVSYKRYGGASDGPHILKESFAINRKYRGWAWALVSRLKSRVRYQVWKLGNAVLRLVLGEEGFVRFKGRKAKR